MPDRRDVKWGSMTPGKSHLSDEYHEVRSGDSPSTDKWDGLDASTGHMSDRYVEMERGGSDLSDKWHEMKQEGRQDPYSMAPSSGDRSQGFKKMAKETPDNKVSRATQHTEFGSTREI